MSTFVLHKPVRKIGTFVKLYLHNKYLWRGNNCQVEKFWNLAWSWCTASCLKYFPSPFQLWPGTFGLYWEKILVYQDALKWNMSFNFQKELLKMHVIIKKQSLINFFSKYRFNFQVGPVQCSSQQKHIVLNVIKQSPGWVHYNDRVH